MLSQFGSQRISIRMGGLSISFFFFLFLLLLLVVSLLHLLYRRKIGGFNRAFFIHGYSCKIVITLAIRFIFLFFCVFEVHEE